MLEMENTNKIKELELQIAQKLGTPGSPPSEGKPQIQLKPPTELAGEPSFAEFKRWELKWKDYSLMVRLTELPLDRQLGIFRSCLSPEMHEELMYGMGIPDNTSMTVDEILLKIRQFIRSKKNISLDRFEFHSCKQQEGETIDHYHVRLKHLAEDAELCAHCCDDQITSVFTVGIKDPAIRKKLLGLSEFPKLEDAVKLCRSQEAAKKNDEALSRSDHKFVGKHEQVHLQGHKPSKYACKCGKHHEKGQLCPQLKLSYGKGQEFSPKKPSRFIKSAKVRKVKGLNHPKAPTTIVQVCPKGSEVFTGITALPDSGADISIAGPKLLSQLRIPAKSLKKPEVQIFACNGTKTNCTGYITVQFRLGKIKVWDKVYICSDEDGLLLSWYTSKGLHILPKDYPHQTTMSRSRHLDKPSNRSKNKPNCQTSKAVKKVLRSAPSNPTYQDKVLIRSVRVSKNQDDQKTSLGKTEKTMAMDRESRTLFSSITLPDLPVKNTRSKNKILGHGRQDNENWQPQAVYSGILQWQKGNRKFLSPKMVQEESPKPSPRPQEYPKPRRSPRMRQKPSKDPVLKLSRNLIDISKVGGVVLGCTYGTCSHSHRIDRLVRHTSPVHGSPD